MLKIELKSMFHKSPSNFHQRNFSIARNMIAVTFEDVKLCKSDMIKILQQFAAFHEVNLRKAQKSHVSGNK